MTTPSADKDGEPLRLSHPTGGAVTRHSHFGNVLQGYPTFGRLRATLEEGCLGPYIKYTTTRNHTHTNLIMFQVNL